MLGFYIISSIVLSPYIYYLRKRYQDSKDKQQFLRDNFYQSNSWIVLMVIVVTTTVNVLFSEPDKSIVEIEEEIPLTKNQVEERISKEEFNIQSQFDYVDVIKEEGVSGASIRTEVEMFCQILADDGHLGESEIVFAYYLTTEKQYNPAIDTLLNVSNPNQQFRNYLLGKSYQKSNRDSLAFVFYTAEIENPDGARLPAFNRIASLIDLEKDRDKARALLQLPESEFYLPYRLKRTALFLTYHYFDYYKVVFKERTKNVNITGIIAAILILGIWLTYLVKLSFFDPVRSNIIAVLLALSIPFTFFTFFLSDLMRIEIGLWQSFSSNWELLNYSVFGIGAVEEFVKILPLMIIMLFRKKLMEPYHYLLYAGTAALGFAFLENILYFEGEYGFIIHGRALTAAVGHMVFSSIFAYGFVYSKYYLKTKNKTATFLIFWGLASLGHGLYDFWLFIDLYLVFVLYFFVLVRIWITLINNCLNNSSNFQYSKGFRIPTIQFYLAFGLTAVLMFEYIAVGFQEGPEQANSNLVGALFAGSFLIAFLGSKLSSLNLIKNYWGKINFSVNPFTDDIVSQNFVGEKILLRSYFSDRGLCEYFADGVTGKIVERVTIQNKIPTFFMAHDDSEWFAVNLDSPIHHQGMNENIVLIKFHEQRSSLNDLKQFRVNFLLVPNSISMSSKNMRKEFLSIGWVFVESHH